MKTINQTLLEELQEFINENPKFGNFTIQKSDKEEVKQWLFNHGYKCEPSSCYDKIHIEYWK